MRIAIAVMFGLAAIVPMSVPADAAKKGKNKLCMATSLDNKKVSFKCKAAEKCCYDSIMNKGTCVAASDVCL